MLRIHGTCLGGLAGKGSLNRLFGNDRCSLQKGRRKEQNRPAPLHNEFLQNRIASEWMWLAFKLLSHWLANSLCWKQHLHCSWQSTQAKASLNLFGLRHQIKHTWKNGDRLKSIVGRNSHLTETVENPRNMPGRAGWERQPQPAHREWPLPPSKRQAQGTKSAGTLAQWIPPEPHCIQVNVTVCLCVCAHLCSNTWVTN